MLVKLKRSHSGFFAFEPEAQAAVRSIPIGAIVEVEIGEQENAVTKRQSRALHVWLGLLAQQLNEGGFDMKRVLKGEVDIPWTKDSAKLYLYKPVLEAMTGKTSTKHMNTVEPSEICKVIGRRLAEKLGIAIPPWPSYHNHEQ